MTFNMIRYRITYKTHFFFTSNDILIIVPNLLNIVLNKSVDSALSAPTNIVKPLRRVSGTGSRGFEEL